MRFNSTAVRKFWLLSFTCWGLDALLSAGTAYLISDGDDFWFFAIAIFLFLSFWPLIYGIRGGIYNILLGLIGRREQIEELKRQRPTSRRRPRSPE